MLPAQIAKAALRRLVIAKLEPTPENYANAYQQEAGEPAAAPAAAAASERPAEPSSVRHALPRADEDSRSLADAIAEATRRIQLDGAEPALAVELEALCKRADLVLQHRHHLVDQLGELCHELTASLTDLAEDDSWA